jgi:ribosome-associated heat shock protein Hsp15
MWLWCARFMRARGDCADWVAGGLLRINRQPTDKPHYRLRVGDVITLALRQEVRVIEVLALATRRGPAAEARALYREIVAPHGRAGSADVATSCSVEQTSAYRDGS